MTSSEIYDWLAAQGVRDPACVALGTRFVVGRWERVGEVLESGYICRAGNVAIMVLGEGDSWIDAHAKAKARLDAGQVSEPLP